MILTKILSKRAQKREKELLKEIETKRDISEYKWGNIGKCNYSDELKEFVDMEGMEYGIISITEDDKSPKYIPAVLREKLIGLLQKYKGRAEDYHETIDTLFKKGVPNGCYQDYELLNDTISILTLFERALREEYHN